MRLELTIPAVPVAQPRPRATMAGKHARVHEQTYIKGDKATGRESRPHPIVAFKATVAQVVSQAYTGPPINQPMRVLITCVFPRPANKRWKKKPMPREPYTSRGRNDWDNLGKSVCDALNEVVWVDDGLIWDGRVIRLIAAGDEQPHVELVIETTD